MPFHVLLLPGGVTSSPSFTTKKQISDEGNVNDYLERRKKFHEKALHHHVKLSVVPSMSPSPRPHQLEIAIAICCENVPYERYTSSRVGPRLNRPVFPANYDEGCRNHREPSLTEKVCILRSGKEGHFVKLLLMHSPRDLVGQRALAIAVLQQTVEWEVFNAADYSSRVNERKWGNPSQAERTESFLVAGGMKLMARWLVDSFTAVPVFNRKPVKQQFAHAASPTGCLLLPLLHFLKSIPFNKNLVIASQIHKSIRRLKKALNALVEGLDPNTLEEEEHPISGGQSVGKVIASIDTVMTLWSKSSAENTDLVLSSSFEQLQSRMLSRFDDLTKFLNEGFGAPSWLPKVISGVWAAPTFGGKPALYASRQDGRSKSLPQRKRIGTLLPENILQKKKARRNNPKYVSWVDDQ